MTLSSASLKSSIDAVNAQLAAAESKEEITAALDAMKALIDANEGVNEQDTKVAGYAHEAGKGIIPHFLLRGNLEEIADFLAAGQTLHARVAAFHRLGDHLGKTLFGIHGVICSLRWFQG